MNLIEALNTGKLIKRPKHKQFWNPYTALMTLSSKDVLAEDWEIKREKKTITRWLWIRKTDGISPGNWVDGYSLSPGLYSEEEMEKSKGWSKIPWSKMEFEE